MTIRNGNLKKQEKTKTPEEVEVHIVEVNIWNVVNSGLSHSQLGTVDYGGL